MAPGGPKEGAESASEKDRLFTELSTNSWCKGRLAEEGIYPAVDIEGSISRAMVNIVSPEQLASASPSATRRFYLGLGNTLRHECINMMHASASVADHRLGLPPLPPV